MIKAVLFDLDGVLVDAVELHQRAFLDAVMPYRSISREEHMRTLNGLPTRKKLEKLGFSPEMIEKINKEKQEITLPLIPQMIHPIPKVSHVIAAIKSFDIPFAVCSNSIRNTVELMLEAIELDGHAFFISNEDVKHAKPDPEMYLTAITKMGLQPQDVLIVEDSPIGLEAAYKSGAQVCPISNPYDITKVLEALYEYNYPLSRKR